MASPAGVQQNDVVAPAVHVKLEIRLLQDKAGQPIPWPAAGVRFFDGDRVQFVIQNPNPYPVDVTLLYTDSGFAISSELLKLALSVKPRS